MNNCRLPGTDGPFWTCGADLIGALGIGGHTWQDWMRAVPVRVLNLANVEAVAETSAAE